MYDQNPLLHKLTIDDLAREHEKLRRNPATSDRVAGTKAILISVAAISFAVFVAANNIA